jgi:hypothetical protein
VRLFGRKKRQPQAALTYWNSSVVERIQRDAGVDPDTAAALFSEMLLFLDLVAASDHFISPPEAVDVAWHAFILHTRDYEAYCRERYGRIIHHQPTGQPDPGAYRRAYERRSSSPTPMNDMIWADPGVMTGAAVIGGTVGSEDKRDEDDGRSGAAPVVGPEGVPGSGGQEGGQEGDYESGQEGDHGSGSGGSDFGGDSGGGDSGGGSSCGGGSG